MAKMMTGPEFEQRAAHTSPGITITGTYRGRRHPVAVVCDECGHEWSPLGETVIRGTSCPVCRDRARELNAATVRERQLTYEIGDLIHPW
jgi:hypothetical protein